MHETETEIKIEKPAQQTETIPVDNKPDVNDYLNPEIARWQRVLKNMHRKYRDM